MKMWDLNGRFGLLIQPIEHPVVIRKGRHELLSLRPLGSQLCVVSNKESKNA